MTEPTEPGTTDRSTPPSRRTGARRAGRSRDPPPSPAGAASAAAAARPAAARPGAAGSSPWSASRSSSRQRRRRSLAGGRPGAVDARRLHARRRRRVRRGTGSTCRATSARRSREFLSAFPGFADQAALDAKLDETLDQLVAGGRATEQTYTADIEPWFGGRSRRRQPACRHAGRQRSPLDGAASARHAGRCSSSRSRKAKAAAWVDEPRRRPADPRRLRRRDPFTGVDRGAGPTFAIAVTDEVMLVGDRGRGPRRRRQQGQGRARRRRPVQGRVRGARRDYVDVLVPRLRASWPPTSTCHPALRPEPSTSRGRRRARRRSSRPGSASRRAVRGRRPRRPARAHPTRRPRLRRQQRREHAARFAPPATTIAYGEVHDAGAAAHGAPRPRSAGCPRPTGRSSQLDTARWRRRRARRARRLDGATSALAVTPDAAARSAAASSSSRRTRRPPRPSFAALAACSRSAAASSGSSHRDDPRTATRRSRSSTSAARSGRVAGRSCPAGYKPEIAFAVTDDVVVIGYGQAFVESRPRRRRRAVARRRRPAYARS